ncbi:MAG: beta-propeller domain-containing protein [Gammaproteobacteria bacterium]|nr:beta-propeller domain-containing protein [Gammaproteobacteria bacterium]NNM12396.1 hypothetical protein [Pseudomonadales bacterium]
MLYQINFRRPHDAAFANQKWRWPVIVATVLLSACAGGGPDSQSVDETIFGEPGDGLLEPVESSLQFVTAMSSAMETVHTQARNVPGLPVEIAFDTRAAQPVPALAAEAGGDAQNFSQTYTLEARVDENDIVKYNGEHLFVAKNRAFICCYIREPLPDNVLLATPDVASAEELAGELDGAAVPIIYDESSVGVSAATESATESAAAFLDARFAPEYQPPSSEIRVLATNAVDATAQQLATIKLEQRGYTNGMYLHNDKLVALSTQNSFLPYGAHFFDYWAWHRQQVNVDIYSVENAQEPESLYKLEVEGGLVDSRRIGNTLYLITRHTPAFYFEPAVELASDAASDADPEAQIARHKMIPRVTINGASRDLFYPTDCWVTNEKKNLHDRAGYPVLTSVTAIPIDDPQSLQTLCYNEGAAGMYVSQQAIYLSDPRYGENPETVIHKFALTDVKAQYRGSAVLPGNVWSGGQNDFRMSEHNGQLRVMTSTFTRDNEDRQDHRLFVLEESVSEAALDIVGQLPNELRPEPIGKPNETVTAVRFFGDRGYIVTFLRIDPLYVLDLSDGRDPKILGELEIPGFSEFLHPVSDSLLLGLGRGGERNARLKLELFDVSDPVNPVTHVAPLFIGEEGGYSYSEAQHNRHAFTYLAGSGEASDRFALPVRISGTNTSGQYFNQAALHLFEINALENPANAQINPAGEIVAEAKPALPNWWAENERSVLHDDAVFYVSGGYVWSALWDSPEQAHGPQ